MLPAIHYVIFFLIDVHPFLVCEKLGPKYASVPVDELNKRQDFYDDLLRYLCSYHAKLLFQILQYQCSCYCFLELNSLLTNR